ncbi:MAG TPA: glycosyltransferase family 4 protein [Acidimicrobiales bacterium]|nr:glycosyltransferase family 4 protein [Acidimicrobiales bacterium]
MSRPVAAVVSFRLGGADGVSVEAAKWAWALRELGFSVRTVAGAGPVDHLIPPLAAPPAVTDGEPDPLAGANAALDVASTKAQVEAALAGADLVIVENLLSLPLNPGAAEVVAAALRGRRAVLRHHDLPWQRPRFAAGSPPPDDPAWRHVTINDHSRAELARLGIAATVIPNAFDPHPPAGDRAATRRALGVGDDQWVVLQPTRAIPRKNVGAGLALAEALGAVFWVLGPAEEGYGPELSRLLAAATVPTRHGPCGPVSATAGIEHAYAACDVVAFPSVEEGFGNPPVEASLQRRPVAVGRYRVAAEMAAAGFRWFDADDHEAIGHFLRHPDSRLLDHNEHIARTRFSLEQLPARLSHLLRDAGWTW